MAGIGAVSVAGLGADALWAAVRDHAVLTGPASRFDLTGYPTCQVGEVPAGALAGLDDLVPTHESLAARYLAAATLEALADAGRSPGEPALSSRAGTLVGSASGGGVGPASRTPVGPTSGDRVGPAGRGDLRSDTRERVGIFVGSVMATRPLLDRGIGPRGLAVRGRAWARPGTLLDVVRRVVRVTGPTVLVASGCSAGNAAIAAGYRAVRAGEVDVAICAGADELSLEVFAMFTALRALAPDVVRPFDVARRGTVPAEGAGVLVLERADRLTARGGRPRARLLGCASSADAYHMTHPHPDGAALVTTLQTLLGRAGRQAEEIDWVCAHGTGTPANDGVEARATAKGLAGRRPPVVSSLKGQLGHAVGAAAALEAVIAVRALAGDLIPGNVTLDRPDPECAGIDLVPAEGRRVPVRLVASPAAGFGGGVTTLLLGREGDDDA
ncbi:beta-ketoacyl synthase N-terminal-like domain-containing protein [Plantactinospora sp. GCM10030261]|uniref:beta-ketoacyl synthase N-terminal-like domain-containing protein n=1 Tax=Plantactinospora sp. GCM10030261 TaxID=3273420 RepID=UPI003619C1D9